MDVLDYWIWEHASKYGMAKVLTRMKSNFAQIDLPNSWIGALVLRQIKQDWAVPNKITFRDLINAQEILAANFKFFKKSVKQIINLNDFIKLTLLCKAAILVKRLETSDISTWRRAIHQMFPIWNSAVWARIKTSFNFKHSVAEIDIQVFHSKIRCLLLQQNMKQTVLDMFESDMKKHFQSLITFLFQIQLSTLEKVQAKQANLDPQLEFIQSFLNKGLHCEENLVNLWNQFFIRKVKLKCGNFLTKKDNIKAGCKEQDQEEVVPMRADIFTLPPQSPFESDGKPIYPKCSQLNPCIPSSISIVKDGFFKEFVVNKNAPRHISGTLFEFHWFSEDCSPIIKAEKIQESSAMENQEQVSEMKPTNKEDTVILTKEKAAVIEKWVNTQQPGTPSSLDSNLTFTYEDKKDHPPQLPLVLEEQSSQKVNPIATASEENTQRKTVEETLKPDSSSKRIYASCSSPNRGQKKSKMPTLDTSFNASSSSSSDHYPITNLRKSLGMPIPTRSSSIRSRLRSRRRISPSETTDSDVLVSPTRKSKKRPASSIRLSTDTDSVSNFKLHLSVSKSSTRSRDEKTLRPKKRIRKVAECQLISTAHLLVNKTMLPKLAETLKFQAESLVQKIPTTSKTNEIGRYGKKLEDCMTRVLRSHGELTTGYTPPGPTNMIPSDIAERVKRNSRSVDLILRNSKSLKK